MKRMTPWIFIALLAAPAIALAQLPSPNEEEAAKKAEAAAKKTTSEEAAKVALGKAQDRTAQRYYLKHPGAARPVPVAAAVSSTTASPAKSR
jgi:hypothetical protein